MSLLLRGTYESGQGGYQPVPCATNNGQRDVLQHLAELTNRIQLLESRSYQINVRQDKEIIRRIQAKQLLDNIQAQGQLDIPQHVAELTNRIQLLESDSYQINVRQDKESIRRIQDRQLLNNIQAQLSLLAGFGNMPKKGSLVWRDAIGSSQDLATRRSNAKKILAHAINKHDAVREFVESDLFGMAVEFNYPIRVAGDQAARGYQICLIGSIR